VARESSTPSPASSKVDDLLPPGATTTPSSPTSIEAESSPTSIEADESSSPYPGEQVAPKTAEGTVAIPTEDGGFVTVRDSVKTVEFQGEEVEVRRLTPEEKQRRRFIKNIIMAILGTLFLAVVTIVLVILT
jgi:hypothetical protein